ncbi:MAG: glycosyltransferase [Deltaproteobacteria bacterium]|nr:glycosyltransferase [Deltaproteobacteria bacterium]
MLQAFERVIATEPARLCLVGPGAKSFSHGKTELRTAESLESAWQPPPDVLVIPDAIDDANPAVRRAAREGIQIIAFDPGRHSRLLRPGARDWVVSKDPTSLAHAMLSALRAKHGGRPAVRSELGPKSLLIFRTALGQGGADRVTITLLQKLDRSKLRPTLILMKGGGPYETEVPTDVPVVRLGEASLWSTLPKLVRVLADTKPDIVFAIGGGESIVAVLAHELTGRKSRLVLSERNIVWNGGRSAGRALQVALKRALYPRAALLTAVSDGVRDDFVARVRLDPSTVEVVFNPMVDEGIDELARAPVSHPWFGAGPEGIPVILGCGRLIPQKGFDVLIRAFAEVRKQRRARLVILGEGAHRNELMDLAKSLSIADDVDLPGFDKNPFKYMARAAVFVLSSYNEGLPGALIQAMASRAPVISTRCPSGPDEIISQPGENGILVPMGHVALMAEAISLLMSDEALRVRMAEAGRLAVQRFEVKRAIEAYERALLGDS